jgi:hypothetical protein
VFSVDPLTRATDVPSEATPDKLFHLERLAKDFPERFIFLPGLSEEVIWRRQVDVLLIDGDHTFDAVYDDLYHFYPYLKPGGLLFMDAWGHPEKPDVRPAWEEYVEQYHCSLAFIGNAKYLHAWKKISPDG